MRSAAVAAVLSIVLVPAAYAACTPNAGPNKPVVCIDRSATPMTLDPATVNLTITHRVKFKFTDGGGRIKIRFKTAGIMDGYYASGANASARGKAAGQTDYEVTDVSTGKTVDPTVIVEPEAPIKHLRKEKE